MKTIKTITKQCIILLVFIFFINMTAQAQELLVSLEDIEWETNESIDENDDEISKHTCEGCKN